MSPGWSFSALKFSTNHNIILGSVNNAIAAAASTSPANITPIANSRQQNIINFCLAVLGEFPRPCSNVAEFFQTHKSNLNRFQAGH